MTTTPPIITEAENLIRELVDELIHVRTGECLCCYVARQLDRARCDNTHRFTLHYRDSAAPRATALLERLSRVGACCCDCELFLNGYAPHRRFWTPAYETDDGVIVEADWPDHLPPCAGVRRGSARPCANWVRQYR